MECESLGLWVIQSDRFGSESHRISSQKKREATVDLVSWFGNTQKSRSRLSPRYTYRKMPDKNEEPDGPSISSPRESVDGSSDESTLLKPTASVVPSLSQAAFQRRSEAPSQQSARFRLGQLLASVWRSLPCYSHGPVQYPRGPLLTGLRLGASYFQVHKKEVA